MKDPRHDALAAVLTRHSTKLKGGDRVLLDLFDVPAEMGIALVRAVRACGAIPFLQLHNSMLTREMLMQVTEDQLDSQAQIEMQRMQQMDAYIAIRSQFNINESCDVPPDRLKLSAAKMRPVIEYRVNKTRWVVLRWPNFSMAQEARMSTEAFEDFYFRVCTLDYAKMAPGMNALKARMEATDRVHIKGPGTDLKFSIKGIPAITCGGNHNIPDGEVFTSPVIDSVEGVVSYSAPSIYQGSSFDNIRLEFSKGKVVNATSNNTQRLNEILDSDEGARYIGEFAIGFNPLILNPMRDILFDEKISGSFHFTPGQAYESADNGNRSSVHWDMVNIQRPEFGGGEIWFDDILIRKDGVFLPSDLQALNPEALLKG